MSISKGEERIAAILNAAGIMFQREKTFEDCKRGKYRFDFYLPNYNTLIEFHGEQHYKHIKWFHKTRQEFQAAQGRDRAKCSYALAYDIPLYIVPYWELDNLRSLADIFKEEYKVKNRFHVDFSAAPQ